MKLGVFGGSFDPVHNGHLELARIAKEQFGLSKVFFVPTCVSPLKPNGAVASNEARLEMLKLAIDGAEGFSICTYDMDRGGRSYTIELMRHLKQEYPEAELFFIIGGDSLSTLHRWFCSRELVNEFSFIIFSRAGETLLFNEAFSPEERAKLQRFVVSNFNMPVSSTELRQTLAEGIMPQGAFIPQSVAEYAIANKIYKN
jgi:nicotinate-nucleotide adenylyltransferase